MEDPAKQWCEWFWGKTDIYIPRITSQGASLPPWISSSTSFLVDKLKTFRRMPQNLKRLLKIKQLEKEIKTKNVQDLASFDENVFKTLQFNQIQKYLK